MREHLFPEMDRLKNGYSTLKSHNKKLIEFVQLVKECPGNSIHLMSLAADALLKQLHTESVGSEEKTDEVKSSTTPF